MAWYRARPCLVQDLFAFFDTFFPAFVSSSCWRTLQCPGYLASLLTCHSYAAPTTASGGPDCQPLYPDGPLQTNLACVDPVFGVPVIDGERDELSRRVKGHFDNTTIRFSIYLPCKISRKAASSSWSTLRKAMKQMAGTYTLHLTRMSTSPKLRALPATVLMQRRPSSPDKWPGGTGRHVPTNIFTVMYLEEVAVPSLLSGL